MTGYNTNTTVIFLQLWHVGRISHSSMQANGALPVAPAAVRPSGNAFTSDGSMVPFETPRTLERQEILSIVEDYKKAAQNAKAAGFVSVEIHGTNGYLSINFFGITQISARTNTEAASKTGPASW